MNPKKNAWKIQAETIINNLNKRQMEGFFCDTAKEAVQKALSMIPDNASVCFGGSMTLTETGLMEALKSLNQEKKITLFDRSTASTPEEVTEIYHKGLSSDIFFMSTNAITLKGELVNIDGTGNRLASLIYGPKEVIILAGMNKVTPDVPSALLRVRNIASPPNCIRLNRKTPCALTGACADCLSPDSICSQIVVTRRSGTCGRIKVILIGEELGF